MDELAQAFAQVFTPGSELSQVILVTLQMAVCSTTISTLIGVPLGILIGLYRFRGKRILMRVLNTLMGLPPVLAGLIVFFILSRSGPLGSLKLLYTVPAMVVAQVVLITPIICGLSATAITGIAPRVHETAIGMGLSRKSELRCLLYECRTQLSSIMFVGFGRAIGEVGAVMMVGGNVQFKTRVMTTSIMLETNRGNFEYAIALGVVLLVISFIINSIALTLQERVGGARQQGVKRRGKSRRIVVWHNPFQDSVVANELGEDAACEVEATPEVEIECGTGTASEIESECKADDAPGVEPECDTDDASEAGDAS